MPGTDGLGAIAEIARRGLAARVLVLTTYDTDADVLPAIEAGATGYLLKDAPRTELLRAVRAAARGESVLSPSVASRRPRAGSAGRRTTSPTTSAHASWRSSSSSRAGTTNREAAKRLFISEATVKTHLLHIYAKLGVNDRAAAVAVGVRPRAAHAEGAVTSGMSSRSMFTSTSQPTALPPPGSSICQSKPNSRRSKFAYSCSPATSPKPAVRGGA